MLANHCQAVTSLFKQRSFPLLGIISFFRSRACLCQSKLIIPFSVAEDSHSNGINAAARSSPTPLATPRGELMVFLKDSLYPHLLGAHRGSTCSGCRRKSPCSGLGCRRMGHLFSPPLLVSYWADSSSCEGLFSSWA